MHWHKKLAGFVLFSLLLPACTQSQPPQVNLTLQVQPSSRPGVYLVTGTTNLPEQSSITVQSVRYLSRGNSPVKLDDSSSHYSVLSRQMAKVSQGKWQTTLNLWQVAPDGRYQESWQLNQAEIASALQPAGQVTFMAIFDPANQPPTVNQQLGQDKAALAGQLVRFTSEGQRYLQANHTLPISLPSGKTVAPILTQAKMNDAWGDRATRTAKEPPTGQQNIPTPKEKQTNAPLSPSNFFR